MTSTQQNPKTAGGQISRKMLVAIVAMFAVIVVPAAAFSMGTCRAVITVTNMDPESSVTCQVQMYASGYAISTVAIGPGEKHVWSYSLEPGDYEFYIYYWFTETNYSMGSFHEDFNLVIFETERFNYEAEKWY